MATPLVDQRLKATASHQYGQYLFTIKPAKGKEKPPEARAMKDVKFRPDQYRRNVIIEMFDARTMKPLWSQTFPKEAPRVWITPTNQTMALVWDVSSRGGEGRNQ